ncbi:hypothetical protein M3I53_23410 [Paraburkholderia sp. CNPSo 3272]|uniref:hypothetical protein n=1 Tax=Paraburkholderia sp. CNPSo 3272 TaxID=2940931 RepID=UPI0020B7CD10|nr:hypothetical protein [Paraburkholderia sp. CNPSo 3272]MCP3726040.1 hypothetical protein [Paraburkholderia sp. CNPSo 3272]
MDIVFGIVRSPRRRIDVATRLTDGAPGQHDQQRYEESTYHASHCSPFVRFIDYCHHAVVTPSLLTRDNFQGLLSQRQVKISIISRAIEEKTEPRLLLAGRAGHELFCVQFRGGFHSLKEMLWIVG